MPDINERVEILEKLIRELSLDLHASRIAITVLSNVVNNASSDPGLLVSSYDQGQNSAPIVAHNHPSDDGYEELLKQKVLALLSKPAANT